jgi:uncharacterized protein (TIGR00303 family)
MIRAYGSQAPAWLERYGGKRPHFICTLGFTETALIPGISAAGATPADRALTALADAEFLALGVQANPQYPLPPLVAGVSPAVISRAVVAGLGIPVTIVNAGLAHSPNVPHLDLAQAPALCVSSGKAMTIQQVETLFKAGCAWGEVWSRSSDYLILGECVVAGTTTALALLVGLGIPAWGLVNSSHVSCNHDQKAAIVHQGLANLSNPTPLELVAAIGDPMQPFVAGVAIAASHHGGVLLAGGTQMLAVYALARHLSKLSLGKLSLAKPWVEENVAVGTTRWVIDDGTGNTLGLAEAIGSVSLLATQLNFSQSFYEPLRRYEQGFVKEGVGAGGCAIAAHLLANWQMGDYLGAIEGLVQQL